MEISGVKENIVRETPLVPEKRPAEKPVPPKREEPVPAPKEVPKVDLAKNEKAVEALTEHLNTLMKSMSYSLQFTVDRERGQVVVKVLDGEGKMIRRIPPEGMGDLAGICSGKTGIMVNEILK